MSPAQRLARLIVAMTQEAVRDPLAPIAASGPVMTAPLRQLEYQGRFNQVFQRLQAQGLLPKGTKQPSLVFPASTMPGALAWTEGQNINIPPEALSIGTNYAGYNPLFGVGQEVPIHELAHTMQHIPGNYGTSPRTRALVEGGAQAWADAVTPRVVGPVTMDDGSYAGYVRQARRYGPDWYMRRQFIQDEP